MMKPYRALLCAALSCVSLCALADTDYPVDGAVQSANREKVEQFRKDAYWKAAPFAVCAVKPMSGIRRTPDLFPVDANFTGPVRLMAAQGEYENGSFMLFAFDSIGTVELKADDLVAKDGARIPAGEIDIKVVKVWYQQGTAWGAFQSDVLRRVPTPELMLHDETLVEVDHQKKENFLRCDFGADSPYQWISHIGAATDHTGVGEPRYDWIHDSDTLKPFALQKNAFKQIIFTCHVPKTTPSGLYNGTISASVGGRKVVDIPVQVKVLPFELPRPAVFRDLNREFIVSAYVSYMSILDSPRFAKNLAAHNMLNLMTPMIDNKAEAEDCFRALSEAGLDTNTLVCALPGSGHTTSFPAKETDAGYKGYRNAVEAASNSMEVLRARFGKDVKAFSYAIDEAPPAVLRRERATWQGFQNVGGRIIASSGYHPYILFCLDLANVPRQPRDSRKKGADAVHAANPDALISWYGDPHSGPENPDYNRRLYGWQTWRNNYDMICQYILFRDNWTEFWVWQEAFLRGLMICYPQSHDIIDTLAWEGLREAVDDIRYGTLLKQLVEKARASKDIDTVYAGRAASTWIAQVDFERSSLDGLRMETVARILDLQARLAKEGK